MECNVSDVTTQEELNARVKAATLIGTLQAGYTDFHYLRNAWKEQTEKEALLGVSMTGSASGSVLNLDLKEFESKGVDFDMDDELEDIEPLNLLEPEPTQTREEVIKVDKEITKENLLSKINF